MRDANVLLSFTRGRNRSGNPLNLLRLELARSLALSRRLNPSLFPTPALAGGDATPGYYGMTSREIRPAIPRLPFRQPAETGARDEDPVAPGHETSLNGLGQVEGLDSPDRRDDSGDLDGPIDAEHAETWLLVKRAQNGDGEAFGALYDRYVDAVFRFIFYRVHDQQLAEDFTSETFLRALRRISVITYQGRDIGAWFMTIARNIVLDHVKSARNRLEFTTGEVVEDERSEPSPEAAVLTMLSNDRLMAAVNALGDEQRECVVLRFIQGLSVAETAEIMGKKEGAIKALQHRAIRKLATDVAGDLT
ncbi:RNA polymerase sigma-70 factor, ECF subfamily [Frankineae bacterium MT45]|nr:RNA polymerase sigma-70 factor, ECF subfamily [Frankineae bacterium MT45]